MSFVSPSVGVWTLEYDGGLNDHLKSQIGSNYGANIKLIDSIN